MVALREFTVEVGAVFSLSKSLHIGINLLGFYHKCCYVTGFTTVIFPTNFHGFGFTCIVFKTAMYTGQTGVQRQKLSERDWTALKELR